MEVIRQTLKNDREALLFKHANIDWLNFSGKEGDYNAAGNREFCIFFKTTNGDFPADVADFCDGLKREGVNIKVYSKEKHTQDYIPGVDYNVEGLRVYVRVKVSFDKIPPVVKHKVGDEGVLVKDDESTIGELDYAMIRDAKILVNMRPWEVNGKTGITLWLNKAIFTLEEDEFGDEIPCEAVPGDDDEPLPFD